jgi:hypothetical protein
VDSEAAQEGTFAQMISRYQQGAQQMPSHLTPGVYEPETLKIMVDALDRAWKELKRRPRAAELARNLMACAIVEAVDAGVVDSTILVDKALHAVRAMISEDRHAADRTPAFPRPRHTDKAVLPFAECV